MLTAGKRYEDSEVSRSFRARSPKEDAFWCTQRKTLAEIYTRRVAIAVLRAKFTVDTMHQQVLVEEQFSIFRKELDRLVELNNNMWIDVREDIQSA